MAFGASTMTLPVSTTRCFGVVAQPAKVSKTASSVGCQSDFIVSLRAVA